MALAVAAATVFKKSRRFGIALSLPALPAPLALPTSELHLEPEPHEPSTKNLRHVLPDAARRAVRRVHVENVAGVQQVVDVHIPAQLARTELEETGEPQVHLLEARFEHRVRRQQFNCDIAVS